MGMKRGKGRIERAGRSIWARISGLFGNGQLDSVVDSENERMKRLYPATARWLHGVRMSGWAHRVDEEHGGEYAGRKITFARLGFAELAQIHTENQVRYNANGYPHIVGPVRDASSDRRAAADEQQRRIVDHEWGHAVNYHMARKAKTREQRRQWKNLDSFFDDNVKPVSGYAKISNRERFAEAFSALHSGDPEFERHPDAERVAQRLQHSYPEWRDPRSGEGEGEGGGV